VSGPDRRVARAGSTHRLATVLTVVVCGLVLAGCRTAEGPRATTRALERAGYRGVSVTLRTGGGIDVVTADAAGGPDGSGPDEAAAVVWHTLPVRFDQLVVLIGTTATPYSYERLSGQFGPRDPALDRRKAGDAVVHGGLVTAVLLGSLLAGAGGVTGAVLVVRALRRSRTGARAGGRRRRDQAGGPTSGLGDGSPMAEGSGSADDADAMPS
jgi:hypothetical protein